MNNRLQAQIQDTKIAPINRLARWSMCVMTGVFLLAFLFAPKPTYAANCLSGLSVSNTTSSGISGYICGSGSATLTVTGLSGGASGSWWSTNYQWYSSPDGVTGWTAIPGASGTMTAPGTVSGTYTTPVYTAGAGCTYYYYRAQLFSMTSACVGFGPTATSSTISIAVCPSAGTITGPTTICVGDTACWTASVAGGTWTSTGVLGINSSTGCGYPISTTGFTITYTVPGGCYATMTGTALYGAGTIVGKHYICPGGTTSLSRTGGGPSSGNWTSSDPTVATVSSGIVTYTTGAAVGSTTTITYQQTGPLGGCFTTFTMTVAALPTAITGNVPICDGNTLSLSDASTGTWLSSNSACAAINSGTGVVTGHNVTTTACNSTITFTDTATGCATTTIVTVNGTPTITGYPGTLCSGSTYTLSGSPSPGSWASSNTNATVGSSSGIVTGTLPGTSGGSAVITYTATSTGCKTTQTVSFNPLPAAITGPGVVCVNATILESTTTSGGTWTIAPTTVATISPVSSTSVNITGVSAGTATLSYTLATGCATSTVITVNPIPVAPVGPASICVGNCVTFTDATGGGTWSSSNAAAATVGSSTGEVCGVGANTAFISYTLPTGCSNRSLVTVNALPSNITGTLTLCVGSTTTLNSATPGGTWSSGTPAVADFPSSSSGVLLGVSVGTTPITYLVTATGCSKTAVATVNPAPATPTGTLLLCPGQCTTLSDTDPGGTWSSGTTAVASIVSGTGVLCGVSAGTSLISYTLTATGCRATVTATVNSSTLPITGTFIMCQGACQTLANATAGGTWSSSNTAIATVGSSSGVVCGASAGTATITYLLPTGCVATQVVTINANPPAIGGTLSVCVGGTSSLSDITTGGTWMSSLPTIGSIGSINGVLGGVSPGTTNITYTLPTSCYITAVATVYAVPAAISGTLTVCQGSTTPLGDATPGGDWTSSNTAVATVSLTTGVVTGVVTGSTSPATATITYTTAGGCYVTADVTVNPLPAAISGGTAACIGSCVTLSSTTPGGTWISSNTSVATVGVSTGVACGVANGTTTITYMLSTGCYATTVVTVSNAPSAIIGTMSACIGSTRTLSHASPGGTWTSSNLAVATIGSSDGIVTALTAGTTIISYVLPGGCFVTGVFTVNAPPSAITGSGAVCAGSTLTLSSTPAGGTWTSQNTAIATVGLSTGIVTGVAPGGVTTITYTISSTGCFTTTPVTVNPSPSAISGTFSMCVGTCTTLTNGTPGGTWSSSSATVTVGSSTGVVCGVSAGTANITYTTSAGCRAFATVTVLALPAPITGSLLICTGTSTSLSSTTPGGTWSVCGGTGVALVGASTGLVTGISPGTVVICYTVGSGCFVSAIVTINSLPAPITGNLSICIGGHTTLSSTTPGGTWSSSNTAVATIGSTTGDVLGVATGTTRITYTAPVTGCYVTADVTVNAAPPAITGPGTVCVGSTITLADVSTGGTWTSFNIPVATIGSTSGIVTGMNPGTAIISYDLSAGCATGTVITVNPTPAAIAGSTPICIGSCISLSTTTAGGTWSSSNAAVATVGSASGVACGIATGTATISYIMPTGCFTTVDVTVNPLPLAITGTNTICQASTTTLSNVTPGGGTWSSSDPTVAMVGSADGIVLGAGGGTAIITFTASATGCFTTFAMTINPLPAPIGGPLDMCEGSSITLTDATSGGIWNSSDPSIATIDATGGWVSGFAPGGVVTITYTLGTGCFVTRELTVNPLPLPITGTLSGCVGVPSTLSDPTAGGTWSATPPGIATIGSSSGIIIGSVPGSATVTYTLPTGCFVTAVYTVNPAPEPIAGTANVCVGSCTTLTSATPGGTWSSANPLIGSIADPTIGVVCGASAGTVTITYTAPTGCYITRVFSVYPIPPAFTGTMVVCEGGTTTLSDIITGGTWSSAVPTTATVGSASGIVTGIDGYGTATITYTLPSSCYVTDVVTVNPNPESITGDVEICAGFTSTLEDATPGGTWSIADTMVATIDPTTGVVTGKSPGGSTTVTYTLTATGCYVATTFIVDPLPDTIAGTKVVCVGQTTLLTNSMGGGTWLSLNTPVATIGLTTGVVTGVSGLDTATILYTLPTGCSTTTVVTVNPLPAPIIGPSTVCMGATITLSDATAGGTWSLTPPSFATISSAGVLTGLTAGTVIVTYTNSTTGCFVTKIITINPNPGAITGLNTMCLGLTTTLVASTHGGTWVSGDTTIAKVIDTTASGDTIVVQGMTAGSTYITYTLPTGCFTVAPVTVYPLPATIGGPSSVCVASTITLTDATAGGTWSINPTTVATIDASSGVVTGVHGLATATVTYTLNGTGCITTKVITVNPLPGQIIGLRDVCVGSTITLHDDSTGGTWSTVDTTIIGLADSVVTGLSMGDAVVTYTLTATGCADTAQIHVHPLPNVIVNHPGMICRTASVLLSASGAGPGASYTWTPPTGLSCLTCQETVASPTITTTYTVTGTTAYGCVDTAIVTVAVDTILNHIRITGKDSICAGTCTTLYAEGFPPGSLFAWRPITDLSCTVCDTVKACPTVTTTYYAIAIDSFGCRDSASITVHIMPLPILDWLPRPAFVCKGDTTQLHAFSSVYGTTFAWYPGVFLTCDSCSEPYAYDTMNLVYRVIGTTPFGCYDSIRVPVSVLENTINTINADTAICIGQNVRLNANAYASDGSASDYLWIPSTFLNDPHVHNPLATPTVTTTYQLIITPNACFKDTLQVTIKVDPYPEISITPQTSNVVAGTAVSLSATITNGVNIASYVWNPAQTLSCEACYNVIATPTVNTTYTFTATSNYGCSSSATATINIYCDNSQVFIPNTFTPNGDGMNDRFYVSAKGINLITRFSIYNRWGEMVYDAHNISPNDPSQGWDGTYKGMVLPPDVFVVIVDAVCELGSPFHYKADVSIVR